MQIKLKWKNGNAATHSIFHGNYNTSVMVPDTLVILICPSCMLAQVRNNTKTLNASS